MAPPLGLLLRGVAEEEPVHAFDRGRLASKPALQDVERLEGLEQLDRRVAFRRSPWPKPNGPSEAIASACEAAPRVVWIEDSCVDHGLCRRALPRRAKRRAAPPCR